MASYEFSRDPSRSVRGIVTSIGLLTLLALGLVTVGALSPVASTNAAQLSENSTTGLSEIPQSAKVATTFVDALNAHNVDGLMDLFTDDDVPCEIVIGSLREQSDFAGLPVCEHNLTLRGM